MPWPAAQPQEHTNHFAKVLFRKERKRFWNLQRASVLFSMPTPKKVHDALNRLAAAENQFLASEFLTPAVRGGQVKVRIASVICTLNIEPSEFEGWGVFCPVSFSQASLIRQATLTEQQRYLSIFPMVRLILAGKFDRDWLAMPAHRGDSRFRIEGLVPVRLVEEAQLFDTIETRFDGTQFWYAGPDSRWDPSIGRYLREELGRLTPHDQLQRHGLTAEERLAYQRELVIRYQATEEARRSREEQRLRNALQHASAKLQGYIERDDVYSVTYLVDGERHVSAVSKRDLTVQMAGICLSGEDAKFDLQSLVGVIREGGDGGQLVRVNY